MNQVPTTQPRELTITQNADGSYTDAIAVLMGNEEDACLTITSIRIKTCEVYNAICDPNCLYFSVITTEKSVLGKDEKKTYWEGNLSDAMKLTGDLQKPICNKAVGVHATKIRSKECDKKSFQECVIEVGYNIT